MGLESDELKRQLDEERAARTAAESRAKALENDLSQRKLAGELARELRRHISDDAVDDVSTILAMSCRLSDGRIVGEKDLLGCVGTTSIVESFLSGRGSYLRRTAAREKPVSTSGSAGDDGRDIVKALADPELMQKWKREDPASFEREFKQHLHRKASRQA
ncbi:MAG: hypothetical protein AMXMBFR13_45890 [Phycisphaerae bacterium]